MAKVKKIYIAPVYQTIGKIEEMEGVTGVILVFSSKAKAIKFHGKEVEIMEMEVTG